MDHEARARDILKALPPECRTDDIIKELVLWSMDAYAVGLADGKYLEGSRK
jgi:hypothetical protein